MSAYDRYHHNFVRALKKEGWLVHDKMYHLILQGRDFYPDILARRNNETVVIEVKGFYDDSFTVATLSKAFGQYLIYRHVLQSLGHQFPIFLGVALSDHDDIMLDEFVLSLFQLYEVNLVVVDIDKEEIVGWKTW